jgi:ATP synthase protein I
MPDDKRKDVSALYELATLGFVFPIATAIGFFGGRWLDGVFHTRPWITIAGTVIGIAAGFANLFRSTLHSNGNE